MKKIKKIATSIKHFDGWATTYDTKASEYDWRSPDILFGLQFEYVCSGQKILDLGCGTGLSSVHFHKVGLRIWGIDGSSEMIQQFGKKGFAENLQVIDLSDSKLLLPYKKDYFHHLTSNGVFYFFKGLKSIVAECARILKKGGTLSFTIEEPKDSDNGGYVNEDNGLIQKEIQNKTGVNVYRHKFEMVKKLLEKYGFKVVKKIDFFAYTSPTTKRDVYFTGIVAQRNQ
jgi:predicted TPR repeat methyltransferase